MSESDFSFLDVITAAANRQADRAAQVAFIGRLATALNRQCFEAFGFGPDDPRRTSNTIASMRPPNSDSPEGTIATVCLGLCEGSLAVQNGGEMNVTSVIEFGPDWQWLRLTGADPKDPENYSALRLEQVVEWIFVKLSGNMEMLAVKWQRENPQLCAILNAICQRPPWLVLNSIGFGTLEWGNRTWAYDVLPAEAGPAELPGFVGFAGDEHLFISAAVPEQYRAPQLWHELQERLVHKDESNACVLALLDELETHGLREDNTYLRLRRDLFWALVAYYDADPTRLPADRPEFRRQIGESLVLLGGLAPDD